MAEFFLTFGTKYKEQEHPVAGSVDPDGYVVIEADTYARAREAAVEAYGIYWSFLYTSMGPDVRHLFPRGELGRIA